MVISRPAHPWDMFGEHDRVSQYVLDVYGIS